MRYFLPISFLLRMQRDPLGYLLGLRRRYGELVHIRSGSLQAFVISAPEFVQEVLVTRQRSFLKGRGLQLARRVLGDGLLTSEGELHQQQRRIMAPGFHRQQVAAFDTRMVEATRRCCSGWQDGSIIDCGAEMHRVTLDIVGRTLFDAEFSSQAATLAGVLNQGRRLFRWGYLLFPLFEWLERFLPPVRWLVMRNRKLVDATLEPVIQAHRRQPRADLLSMLMEAGLSDEAVRDQAVTLLLAGNETTANSLAWTFHLLASHPRVQEAVHAELDEVLEGRLPEARDVLPQLERVLLESMRIYPPNWMISRIAREEVQLGDHRVPAGATCLVSQYVVHRDVRWFPDPEVFDPTRWERTPRANLPRYAYFPFGGGGRMCVGEHFAMLEARLVLATVLQQWTLDAVPGQRVAPDPGITLRPLPGPRVRLRSR